MTVTGLPGTLGAGQQTGLTFSYTAPATGPVDVTATIGATGDSNAANNSAVGRTEIVAGAGAPDLISIVAPPAGAAADSIVRVPLTYSNLGPGTAAITGYRLGLSATDAAPTEVEIRYSGTPCTYVSGTVTGCGLPSSLNPGQRLNLELTYRAPASGTVTVTSDISATGELNLANNPSSGSTRITVAPVPPAVSVPTPCRRSGAAAPLCGLAAARAMARALISSIMSG